MTRLNVRSAALLAVGALAVHDLRVVAGYGHDAELVLRQPGHAYLPFATGFAMVLLLAAAAQFTRALARTVADRSGRAGRAPLLRRWLGCSVLLAVTYLVQAGAESFFDPGHPVLGHGGWSVGPLALVVGLVIALATREADCALVAAAARPVRWRGRGAQATVCRIARRSSPRCAPLASQAAGRAPPLPA